MTAICCPGEAPCPEHLRAQLVTLHRELLDGLYEACRALDSWEEFRWLTFHLSKVREAQRIADDVRGQVEYLKRDLAVLRNAIRKAKSGFAPLGGGDTETIASLANCDPPNENSADRVEVLDVDGDHAFTMFRLPGGYGVE